MIEFLFPFYELIYYYYLFYIPVIPVIDRTGLVLQPSVVINHTLAINCIARGIPDPEIAWLRNGELLDSNVHPNIQALSGGRQLRIESAAVTDAAVYRCLATNKAGHDSVDFQVSVHSKLLNLPMCSWLSSAFRQYLRMLELVTTFYLQRLDLTS